MNFWLGVLVGWLVCGPASVFIVLFFQSVSRVNRLNRLRDEYTVSDDALRRFLETENG